jgi:hypothetical protein
VILWKDVRHITVTGTGKARVNLVSGEEQTITFGLQSVTGKKDGTEFSLDRVKTFEAINP